MEWMNGRIDLTTNKEQHGKKMLGKDSQAIRALGFLVSDKTSLLASNFFIFSERDSSPSSTVTYPYFCHFCGNFTFNYVES